MSHPPNTMSSRRAMGTNSLIRGERLSVRLPRRTVPIWVRLPMGRERPVRMASTPAMNVVATAPIPGSRMPSFPRAGAISRPFSLVMDVPSRRRLRLAVKRKMLSRRERGPGERRRGSGGGGGQAAGAGQEVQGRGRELAVVAGSHEAPLGQVVVEDAGAAQVVLGLERVEHQDPAVAGKAAVVEEAEAEVTHGHARSPEGAVSRGASGSTEGAWVRL